MKYKSTGAGGVHADASWVHVTADGRKRWYIREKKIEVQKLKSSRFQVYLRVSLRRE